MKLITISGLDGSGKSTQINLLKEYLLEKNKQVFYFHAVSFSIASKLFSRGKKPGQAKAITAASRSKITLRKLALLIDCLRFQALIKKLSSKYDYLLSDRYFYDQIVNILYLEKSTEKPDSWWQKTAKKLIIKPDLKVYLKTSPEEILKRERLIEQGPNYLRTKENLYNSLAKSYHLEIIDGQQKKKEIFNQIIDLSHI